VVGEFGGSFEDEKMLKENPNREVFGVEGLGDASC
jgi:hypothetical protein